MLRNRIAVNISFFLNGFIYANWVSRLPRIQEMYDADNGTIGFVLLAMSLGAVVAMPFTGGAIIKKGSRTITLLSLILYCAFVPLIPFMQGLIMLTALYVVMGVTTGMLDVAMNAQAVIVEQAFKKPIMTSFHAFFSIGMMLGAWCGALFSNLGLDLSAHLVLIAAIAFTGVVWVRGNLIRDRPEHALHGDGPLFRIPNKALIGVGVIAFCCMMGEGAMSDWTVNYMENVVQASMTVAPLALSAFALAMTLGRIFGDRVRSLWGDARLIVTGGITASLGLCLAVIFPTIPASVAGFFLVGLGLATIVPITYSIAGNEKGLPSGVGLAMVTTVGYAGFLFGPPIIGFVADLYNLRIGLLLVVFLFLIMTFVAFARSRQRAPHGAAGSRQ